MGFCFTPSFVFSVPILLSVHCTLNTNVPLLCVCGARRIRNKYMYALRTYNNIDSKWKKKERKEKKSSDDITRGGVVLLTAVCCRIYCRICECNTFIYVLCRAVLIRSCLLFCCGETETERTAFRRSCALSVRFLFLVFGKQEQQQYVT